MQQQQKKYFKAIKLSITKLSKNFGQHENIKTELARNLMYESLFNENLLNQIYTKILKL